MGRRSRKSKRRVNSLLLPLLLTAIMLIMSTYAWFTANRVVTINGISAHVTVAEGLQISLDGENWSSSIDATPTTLGALGQLTGAGGTININNWQWPSDLVPVSTDGTLVDGLPLFKSGDISTDGLTLSNIGPYSPAYNTGSTPGSGTKLIIFDVYLRNTSATNNADTLQLGNGTKIEIDTENDGVLGTGLENSTRVGVLLYDNTVSTSAQDQYNICNLSVGTGKFAIWEPNHTAHISNTVEMDPRLNTNADAFVTRAIARSTGTSIADVVDVEENDTTNLKEVLTTTTATGLLNSDVTLKDANVAGGSGTLTLTKNAVSKVKLYIWLEGQDPDCNDFASAGGQVKYTIKFTKPNAQSGG